MRQLGLTLGQLDLHPLGSLHCAGQQGFDSSRIATLLCQTFRGFEGTGQKR